MSCDCDPLIVGEAGPQGPQGLAGSAGTNGTNGVNAFTTVSSNFTQPSVNSSVAMVVGNNTWIAVGQILYISQAGYYRVTGLASSTGVTATLVQTDGVAPAGTVTSGSKVTPSGNVLSSTNYTSLYVAGDSSLDGNVTINDSGANKDTRIEGDTDTNLLFVDASADYVGVGTNTPAAKLHVQGGLRVTGSSDLRGAVVINENGSSSADVRVEGGASPNLVYIDSSNNRVGINTNSPGALVEVNGAFEASTATINQNGNSGAVFSILGGSSTVRVYVTDNAVGIGTTTPSNIGVGVNQTNLAVNGVLSAAKLAVTTGTVNSAINGIYYGAHTFSGTFTIAGSTTTAQDVTVTGASIGDVVLVGTPSPSAIGFITDVSIQAVVSAANTVKVVFRNHTATVYTFTSGTSLKVVVLGAQALP